MRDDDEPRRRGVRRDGAGVRGRRDLRVLRRAGCARRRSRTRGPRRACASSRSSPSTRATSRRPGGSPSSPSGWRSTAGRRPWGSSVRQSQEPSRSEMRPTSRHESSPLAEPGTIVVGEATARRLEHRFVFEPLGDFEVKGRAAPVSVFRLVGPKAREPVAGATPVVGRDERDGSAHGRARRARRGPRPGRAARGRTRDGQDAAADRAPRARRRPGRRGSKVTVSRTAASPRGRSWKRCSAGSGPTSARPRSPSGRRLGRSSVRCSAPSSTTCSPASAGSCAFESTRRRTREAPSGSGRRTFAGWRRSRGSSRSSSRSRTCTGRTPRRGSSPRRFSTSPSGRRSHWSLTEEVAPGSEGAALRLRALGDHGHRTTQIALGPLVGRRGRRAADGHPRRRGRRRHPHGTRTGGGGEPPLPRGARRGRLLEGGLEPRGRTWTITVRADLLPPALENLLVARIDRLPPDGARGSPRSPRRSVARSRWRRSRRSSASDVGESLTALLRAEIVREARRYPGLRVLVHARPPARRRAVDGHADPEARALRARRVGVRVALRRLARRAPRAARALPRAGREPAEGVRVRGARPRRLRLARLEPPVLRVLSDVELRAAGDEPADRAPDAAPQDTG